MTEVSVEAVAERETDDLEEVFFSTPPPADEPEIEPWAPQPMGVVERRAMKATVAMLGCAAMALIGFAALSELVMVFPVPLSAAHAQRPDQAWPAPVAPSRAPSALVAPSRAAYVAARSASDAAKPAGVASAATPAPVAAIDPPAPVAPAPAPVASALAPVAPAPAPVASALAPVAPAPAPVAPAPAPHDAPVARPRKRAAPVAKLQPPRTTQRPGVAEPSGPALRADGLVKRASSELGRGNAHEAQLLANQAILADPTRARSYIVLGGARDALGDQAGKRAAFRACVQHARDALVSTCRTLAR